MVNSSRKDTWKMTLFSFLRDQSAWKVWPSIAQLYSARLIAFNRGSIETVTALPLYPNWMEIESDSFGECTSPADYLCQKGVDGIEFRRLINRQHNRFDFYSITAGRPAGRPWFVISNFWWNMNRISMFIASNWMAGRERIAFPVGILFMTFGIMKTLRRRSRPIFAV